MCLEYKLAIDVNSKTTELEVPRLDSRYFIQKGPARALKDNQLNVIMVQYCWGKVSIIRVKYGVWGPTLLD